MRNEYPPEYDICEDDTICAQCGEELPEIPADAGSHLGPLWEGFCRKDCMASYYKDCHEEDKRISIILATKVESKTRS